MKTKTFSRMLLKAKKQEGEECSARAQLLLTDDLQKIVITRISILEWKYTGITLSVAIKSYSYTEDHSDPHML